MGIITGALGSAGAQLPAVRVSRRFQHFATLRKMLIRTFPQLPPLPSKTWNRHSGLTSVAKNEFGGEVGAMARPSM